MPYFMFMGLDGPEGQRIRRDVREQHRTYLRQPRDGCVFVSGGPLLDPDSGGMCGSLLIFEAKTIEYVRGVLDGDPYRQQGLYATTTLRLLDWTVGAPERSQIS